MRARPILAGCLLLLVGAAGAQSFAPGSLAVVVLGDGTTSLTSAGTATRLANYSLAGTLLSTANVGIFNSGSASSEGALHLAGNAVNELYLGGYTSGGAAVSGSTGSANPRAVARFDWTTGTTALTTLAADDYSAGAIRSAIALDGTLYTGGAGNDGGILQTPYGPTANGARLGTNDNARVVQVFGGAVYFSAMSTSGGASYGVNSVSPSGTITPIASVGTSSSPYDFLFTDPDTLYVTDDRSSSSGGGVYRFVRSGGVFGAGARVVTTPTRQLAFDGTTIYATTTEASNNRIVSFDLSGANLTTLASAGTNKVFRGVEVVPEPATLGALTVGLAAFIRRGRRRP